MRKAFRVLPAAACPVLLVAGQSLSADTAAGKKITFTKHPNPDLGFLSASFGLSAENMHISISPGTYHHKLMVITYQHANWRR
jgi:hypothetical protein